MNPVYTRAHLAWLHAIAGMVLAMVVVGGITRLTGSGLSITDWAPFMGAIPPLNEADWNAVFEKYKASPQYLKVNTDITLEGFKFIFFWEYIHRLIGRMIGVVVLLPGIWFWVRGRLPRPLLRRVGIGFILGGLQGFIGWFMVMSGLVDRPSVSHYRLASHFLLALFILAWFVWTIRDVQTGRLVKDPPKTAPLNRPLLTWTLSLLVAQFIYGAFVAGMKAGFTYNTFPLMNGRFIPPEAWLISPGWLNLFENPAMIQWIHRYLAVAIFVLTHVLWLKTRKEALIGKWSLALFLTITAQFLLGVLTLVNHVPLWLGVLHQFMAGVIVILGTGLLHDAKVANTYR